MRKKESEREQAVDNVEDQAENDATDDGEYMLERLPTHAFGYEFTHIPDFVRDDLGSLEREGVLYSDQWVDELDDFRHVRISLTPAEAKDYARRCWAYELYLLTCPR